MTTLEAARFAHSEACEAESLAWDEYNAHLESCGLDSDLKHPLYKVYHDAKKVVARTLDAVFRAKGNT